MYGREGDEATRPVRLFSTSWRIRVNGPEVEGTADSGGTSEGEYLMLLLIKDATEAPHPPLDCWSFTCGAYFDSRGLQ